MNDFFWVYLIFNYLLFQKTSKSTNVPKDVRAKPNSPVTLTAVSPKQNVLNSKVGLKCVLQYILQLFCLYYFLLELVYDFIFV